MKTVVTFHRAGNIAVLQISCVGCTVPSLIMGYEMLVVVDLRNMAPLL